MGSNCKSYGGKCGCSKRVKKAQRVPQRGPGVAELEKILSDQKQEHVKPLYNQPHYHVMRPAQLQAMMPPLPSFPRPLAESYYQHSQNFGGSGNVYVKPWRSVGAMKTDIVDSSSDSRLSFTQMMMMGDPQEFKPNANPVFQPNMMNNCYPSSDHCPSQRFYNKCPLISPKEDKNATKKAGWEMSFYNQQLGQTGIENGRSTAEDERSMLRNILTLGPPSPTKASSLPLNPIFIESDSSEEQCKDKKLEDSPDKSHQSQIFGFNLLEKSLSLDETRLSLHYNAAQAEELSLDLTLKL